MLNFAKEHRNRTVEHYGCLPTKKFIYEWKKSQRELQYLEKNKHHLLTCHKVATMRRRDGRMDNRPQGGGVLMSQHVTLFTSRWLLVKCTITEFDGTVSWGLQICEEA